MKLTDEEIAYVLRDVRAKAADSRENAAYNGEMGDGGAGHAEALAATYEAGMQRGLPSAWTAYEPVLTKERQKAAEAARRAREEAERAESDADFARYLELRKRYDRAIGS